MQIVKWLGSVVIYSGQQGDYGDGGIVGNVGFKGVHRIGRKHAKILLVMKLTAFIMLVGFLQVSAKGVTQTITLSVKDVPLTEVLEEISKQSGYKFFYNREQIKKATLVNLEIKNATLDQALSACFKNQSFTYSMVENIIVIKKIEEKHIRELIEGRPPIDIKGKVVNEKGEPVEGVSVRVKGHNIGTSTDANGDFSLKGVPEDGVLILSAVNIQDVEWKVGGKSEMIVNVKIKISQEQEVITIVSTGYQDLPKERATGSFFKVDNELFNRKISASVLDRLYEVTSGLIYTPGLSSFTTRSSITIRGISTINSNMKPLIVIDGFPYDERVNSGEVIINNINPNDIESVTILKDAAAASIWGARAGNGVIVINTKKAKFNQKPNIQFISNFTVSEKPKLFKKPTISSQDAISYETELFKTGIYDAFDDLYPSFDYYQALSPAMEIMLLQRKGSITQDVMDNLLNDLRSHDIRSDLLKHFYRNQTSAQYAINFSGGSANFNYYFSAGLDKGQSVFKGSDNSRYTVRIDNSYRPFKNIEVNGYVVWSQNREFNTSITPTQVAPYTRLIDNSGNAISVPNVNRLPFVDTATYPKLLDWHYKPLEELNSGYNNINNQQNSTRLGTSLKVNILPGLVAEIKYQYEKSTGINQTYYSPESFLARNLINQYMFINTNNTITYPIPLGGILDAGNTHRIAWNLREQVNFNKKWKNNELAILIGSEFSETDYNFDMIRRYGFNANTNSFSNNIDYNSTFYIRGSAGFFTKIPQINQFDGDLTRLLSHYGNASYCYRGKYTVSFSVRKDGANILGVKTNQRFTPLWSGGLYWDISKEYFYKISILPVLKLRATFGYNGNIKSDAITLPTISFGNRDGLTGATWAQFVDAPNPSLRWEKNRMLNLGIDFQVRSGRVVGNIEYYTKKGYDLISRINTVDPTVGFTSYVGNNANLLVKGIDVSLTHKNIKGKMKWETNVLFSYTKDEVTKYEIVPSPHGLVQNPGVPLIGRSLFSIYSYRWGGLDPSNGNPRGFISDSVVSYQHVLAGTNTKLNDIVYNGPASPRIFGSIRNSFYWNNISLSFVVTYRFRYSVRRESVNYSDLFNGWSTHGDYLHRWTKAGDEAFTNIPSSIKDYPDPNRDLFYKYASVLIEKGDHVRLQDVRVGYTFDKFPIKSIDLRNLSFYLYANNLGIVWKSNQADLDPDYGYIPPTRSISLGLTLNL